MDRQEYPTMMATLQPSQATTVLHDRIRHINKTNTDIAEWLAERVRLEQEYAQGLKKLTKRSPPDSSSDLGVFDTPWRKILQATDARADATSTLAKRIESDVVRPLREFESSSRQMQQLSTIQGNLLSMQKDYDRAEKNAEKAKAKPGPKSAGASAELDNAASQWESQAPYVFENLQAADERRWNHLRDVLTQLQTHEVDSAQRYGATSEGVLNALLNVETADEIKTFALKNTGSGSGLRSSTGRAQSRQGPVPPTIAVPPASPPNGDDLTNQRSNEVSEEKSEKKGGLGGLRRLGTVLSRRKSVVPKGTPSKRSAGGNLAAIPDEEPERESESGYLSTDRPDPPRTFSGIEASMGSPTSPTGGRVSTATNGDTAPQLQAPLQPSTGTLEPAQPASTFGVSTGAAGERDLPPEPQYAQPPSSGLSEIDRAQQEAALSTADRPYQMDIRNAPIPEDDPNAQAAMANVASTLRAQAAPQSRRAGTVRGRRDVRNTMFVPSPEPGAQSTAFQPTGASIPENYAPPHSNTISSPLSSPATGLGLGAIAGAGVGATAAATSHHAAHPSDADTQSIRSTSAPSLASTSALTLQKHPEHLTSPGVNSSIVETVSAWFSNNAITRAVVIGELALAHNPSPATQAGHVPLRLENFPILEKVAPNPAFVQQPSADRPGEYTLDVHALGNQGRPAVAFKYQVHLDENTPGSFAPLLIHTEWRINPTQAGVIASVSLNPAFAAAFAGSVTLSNIFIGVHINETRASSCQSKPSGTFNKERGMVYWRFDSLTLSPGAPAERLVARFATESEARAGDVEARWEILGEGPGSGLGVSVSEGGDPFADVSVGVWKSVQGVRKLVSGTYVAN